HFIYLFCYLLPPQTRFPVFLRSFSRRYVTNLELLLIRALSLKMKVLLTKNSSVGSLRNKGIFTADLRQPDMQLATWLTLLLICLDFDACMIWIQQTRTGI
ncbi:MAG: hypothetical protein ACJARG_001288, partial [Arcticibacterium sp.]